MRKRVAMVEVRRDNGAEGPLEPQELADSIAQWTVGGNTHDTLVPGLTLHRWDTPTEPASYILGPSICLIGQGSKRVLLGGETYVYDANSFLLTSVDLPLTAHIIEADAQKPYLGLTLALELRLIARLVLDHAVPVSRPSRDRLGIAVSPLAPPLRDALRRLIGLLAQPQDIPVLAPLITQEIHYRLLTGGQGPRLLHMLSAEGQDYNIARAIDWLKSNFRNRLKVEELAAKAGMSVSAFHTNFRAVTAMSPLQFQKKMRLSEARRLMFIEHKDASAAAFAVGYESPSQFSREYSRLFGSPPKRDIKSLGQVTAG